MSLIRRKLLKTATLASLLHLAPPLSAQGRYNFDYNSEKWRKSDGSMLLDGVMKETALEVACDYLVEPGIASATREKFKQGFTAKISMPEDFQDVGFEALERAGINTKPLAGTDDETRYHHNAYYLPQTRVLEYDVGTGTAHIVPFTPGGKRATYQELWYNALVRAASAHVAINQWGGSNFDDLYDRWLHDSRGLNLWSTMKSNVQKESDILQPLADGTKPPSVAAPAVRHFFNGLGYLIASRVALGNKEEDVLYEKQFASEMRGAARQISTYGDPVRNTMRMSGIIERLSELYAGAEKDSPNKRVQHVAKSFLEHARTTNNPETSAITRSFYKQ